MLNTTRVLLAAAVLYAGGDSSKNTTTRPPAAAGKVAAGKAAAGKAATVPSSPRGAAPRLPDAASTARVAGGPPVPAKFRATTARVSIVADSLVVEKARRTLTLYYRGRPVRKYFVALGKNPVGPKVAQGDGRTPEGLYHIESHNPDSQYHLSLKVSYPNESDIASARARGVSTGGDIMIHGLPKAFASYGAQHRQWDWTLGCIAVTDEEIEEIWSAVGDGAAMQIKP